MNALKQHKNKIIITFALLLALASYAALTHFTEHKQANNTSAKKYEALFKATTNDTDLNTNPLITDQIDLNKIKGPTYDVSYPTIGPLFVTTPARVITETSQLLLKDSTAPIKKNQRVLFYAPDGRLVDEGKIASIKQAPNEDVKVSYSLNSPLKKTSEKKPISSADIILRETGSVKRIPQSALSYENGAYFVYLIKTKRDQNNNAIIIPTGQTIVGEITKQPVRKTLGDKWHAAVSYKVHKADLVLLNPNTEIKNTNLIKIHIIKSPPPVLSRTQLWLKKVEKQRIIDVKEGQEKANRCNQPATGSKSTSNNETSSTPSGSCNSHPDDNAPFDAFKLLGIERL